MYGIFIPTSTWYIALWTFKNNLKSNKNILPRLIPPTIYKGENTQTKVFEWRDYFLCQQMRHNCCGNVWSVFLIDNIDISHQVGKRAREKEIISGERGKDRSSWKREKAWTTREREEERKIERKEERKEERRKIERIENNMKEKR